MKNLMTTVAAIALSATAAFAAAPSDVEHLVDNEYSYSSWANAFFTTYADEFGGQAFTNLSNTITTLEALVVSAQNELENEYTSYQIYLDGGMEADAELSQIQIYALSGKIQGTNKLIATIEGLHDTSALDAANDTIDHLNDQLAYWGTVIADQKAELATIAADTTAAVTAEFEGVVADLEATIANSEGHIEALISAHESVVADLDATVMTATAVNTDLKGELFTAQANNELLATEINTLNELVNSDYDSLLDSVKTLEAEVEAAESVQAEVADVIEGFNPRDADKYRADAPGFIKALYNYILSIQ